MIPLRRQLLTCLVMVLVALLLIRFVQHAQLPDVLLAGLPWPQQALLGAALGLLVGGASLISALRKPGATSVQRTAGSYGQLDLHGLNPVWIALAAGAGEELLFRAALQPLLGIWLSSALFLLLHTRAYDFRRFDRTALLQAAGVMGMSLVFGLVALYAGLIAAVLAHTLIDILGLYAVRRVVAMSK
ncbi:CPBP family intramembrane metalloprotease [Pseudoduganella eburnea]|uniref:CPBP family intramembrane metalloprotease n=1 Tax=Massilia eburnea TaxID=1776165 RepID=A0A6L6QJ89_9BURK|nr:CPBP family intramembrane glutamic endopeptidase [Massilia eburnea]MTW12134.1 CPBP family intramembrane metalloprotease [Massilia eburnea]